jgi:hypothetical protein
MIVAHGGEYVEKHNAPAMANDLPLDQPTAAMRPLAELFERARQQANGGDLRAREALRTYLDGHPDAVERLGNLARLAEETMLQNVSGGEWLTQEAVRRDAVRRREALAGPAPTLLETMAIDRVVACWMGMQDVRITRSQARADFATQKYWDQREEQAYRLYDAALRSLALLRGPLADSVRPAATEDRIPQPSGPGEDSFHRTVPVGNEDALRHGTGSPSAPPDVPVNRINGALRRVNGHGCVLAPAVSGSDGS